MSIKNKNVIVTGASRGLGKALATVLAERGARVVLVARDPVRLADVVRESKARGLEVHGIAADVSERETAARIVAEATDRYGAIDVLINNASTLGPLPMPALFDTDADALREVIEVNTVGPFRLIKAVGGHMVASGAGVVVNVSSDAATEPYPNWGAYGASKAALDHLTRIWAAEVADDGVRFIAVDPGEMNTDMHRDAMPDADPSTLENPTTVAERIADMIDDDVRAPNGARLVASRWAVRS